MVQPISTKNGTPDSFSIRGTEDSMGYIVWPGEPNAGEPLWTNSSYLGDKLEGVLDCPGALNF